MKENNNLKIKYPSLNGLRAISISLVIMHHLSFHRIFDEWMQYKALAPFLLFLQDGHLGVNVFFVISGFLISSLLLNEEEASGTISIRQFYIRRTLRIFPAYYFYLFVLFVLQLTNVTHLSSASWLTSITYTKYFNWSLDWVTAHAWSLSVEEQFYLFFPLIFILRNNIRKRVAFFLVIAVPIIKVILHFHPVSWIDEFSIFTRIDAIALGCLIAFYKEKLIQLLKANFLLYVLIAFIGLFVLRHLPDIEIKFHVSLAFIIVPFGLTHGTIANVFIGVILLYSVFGPENLWFRLLNSKILNYIGLISYSLYLWQQLFISEFNHWITSFPQNILFTFLAALFSYYCIEKPFLKLKAKFQK